MSTDTTQQEDQTGLRRAVTGPLLFVFVLGDVLGAGIYALMGVLSQEVGGALWAPLLIALLMALLTAGSYAELVTKYPKAGGSAVFAQRAFRSPLLAFLVGFAMLAAGVVSAAGLALAFAGDYLTTFIDVPPVLAAMVFLILMGAVNARGIRESLTSNVVMTVIEVSGLVIVIVVAAVFVGGGGGDVSRIVEFPTGVHPAAAILGGRSSPITRSSGSRRRRTWPRKCVTRAGSTRVRCSGPSPPRGWCTCSSASPAPRCWRRTS